MVKVSEVKGRGRVKDTVARSRQKINRSMLLCENICLYSGGSDGLPTNVCEDDLVNFGKGFYRFES